MFSIIGLIIAYLIHTAYGLEYIKVFYAPDGKYPYQVSLKHAFSRQHYCGGVIVSHEYVLIAAHCLKRLHSPAHVLVDVGSTCLYCPRDAQRYTADSLIIHPNYNTKLLLNDIALIKLTRNIMFNKNVRSIELISYDRNFTNVKLTNTGWGRLYPTGPTPKHMQQITMKGLSNKICGIVYDHITNNQMCTFQPLKMGQNTCFGMSGGPLTYNGTLVGIMSFGIVPCKGGFADVSTKVYYYREWINKHINAGNNQQSNIILGLFMTYLCIYSFL